MASSSWLLVGPEKPVDIGDVEVYWAETFRRIILVKLNGQYLVVVDVYAPYCPSDAQVVDSMEVNDVKLLYAVPRGLELHLDGVERVELVLLLTDGMCETISVRLWLRSKLSREQLQELYRSLVRYVEGRDPIQDPLKPPRHD